MIESNLYDGIDAGCEFSEAEIEAEGVRLDTLREGDWFATNVASPDRDYPWLITCTGEVVRVGPGSVTVQLDRDRDPITWAREAKVIKLVR